MSILCDAFGRRTNKLNIALLRMCSTNAVRIANKCWDTGAVRIANKCWDTGAVRIATSN